MTENGIGPRKLVVAGMVLAEQSVEVLLTQRRQDQAMANQWEFPGGKVESGESPEAALARELLEEIGCRVEVGRVWDVLYHQYPDFELVMLVYLCRIQGTDVPQCREVQDLCWCTAQTLRGRAILPADAPLIRRLEREGLPQFQSRSS